MSYGRTAWVSDGERMTSARREMELLPDENPDLKAEILEVVGEYWLNAPNAWLSCRAPAALLGTAEEPKLRDLVRSIKSADFS